MNPPLLPAVAPRHEPLPRVTRRRWSDPDERMAGSTGAFSKRIQRLAAGPFTSEIAHVDMGVLRFGHERIDGAIRVHGQLPDGYLYVSVDAGRELRLNGRLITHPTLHLHGAGARFDAALQGPMTTATLVVHRDALEPAASAVDPMAEWFDAGRALRGEPGPAGLRLSDLLLALGSGLADGAGAPSPTPLLRDELLSALREAISTPRPVREDHERAGPSSRRRLALSAEELILSTDDAAAPSVAGMARRFGVGERTLQLAFQEQFGTSIRAFLLMARLRRAHAALLQADRGTTLTEIATRHGFWHLGRFSQYYRAVYGCLPSVALRRTGGSGPRPEEP